MPFFSAPIKVKVFNVEPAWNPTPPPCAASATRLYEISFLAVLLPYGLLAAMALIAPVPGWTSAWEATGSSEACTYFLIA